MNVKNILLTFSIFRYSPKQGQNKDIANVYQFIPIMFLLCLRRFKSYIEQRQKHNAKYHHHSAHTTFVSASSSPSSTITSSSFISTASVPQTTTPALITGIATMVTSSTPIVTTTPFTVGLTSTVHGPTPVQVQNMITKVETTTSSSSSSSSCTQHGGGLLISKTEQGASVQQKQTPLSSPTTPIRKNSDTTKESTSFLSSLLASPANEIKAQVTKITEELKVETQFHFYLF